MRIAYHSGLVLTAFCLPTDPRKGRVPAQDGPLSRPPCLATPTVFLRRPMTEPLTFRNHLGL